MQDSRHPDDDLAALILFHNLIQPILSPQRPWVQMMGEGDGPLRMHWNVKRCGEACVLNDVWKDKLRPRLDALARPLAPILENTLALLYHELRALRQMDNGWDPLSWGRQRLWEDDQMHDHEVDLLITALRHVLEWFLENDSQRADTMISEWWQSDMMIFKRLAMHGRSQASYCGPDEKITWLLDNDLLYCLELKSDVFHFLQITYPIAGPEQKRRLLDAVRKGPDDDARTYEVYNLLYWLQITTPDCELAATAFKQIQDANPDFEPRRYPDLDYWTESGPYVSPPPPKNADALLGEDPRSAVRFLRDYKPEDTRPFRSSREDLLSEVSTAVARGPEWGLGLAKELAVSNEWQSEMWDHVIRGWENASLTGKDWQGILSFLADDAIALLPQSTLLARFLETIVSREARQLPVRFVPKAQGLADKVWQACTQEVDESPLSGDTLYIPASQHPGGRLTMFLLWTISLRRRKDGDKWRGLPRKHIRSLVRVTEGGSPKAEMGLVMLGRQLDFLFAVDAAWMKANVIPLFDWSGDERRATLLWHGFLSQTGFSDELFAQILPYYRQCFKRLRSWSGLMRKVMANNVADAAIYGKHNPLDGGWLMEYMAESEPADRKEWTTAVMEALRTLDSDVARGVWDLWLGKYWQERIDGRPEAIDPEESKMMMRWVLYLTPVFSEAVDMACKTPTPKDNETLTLWQLAKGDYASQFPKPASDFLLHLLRHSESLMNDRGIDRMVRTLGSEGADPKTLRAICGELLRLGCPTAAELADLIVVDTGESATT